MKILHVVPGLGEKWNGIAVAAKLIAQEQGAELIDCLDCSIARLRTGGYDEVWVHSMWLPQTMRACWKALKAKKSNSPSLVRMTHGCLDPMRLAYHGWKKRLVGPVERWIFSKTDRVVVTCAAEKEWCERWGLRNEFEVVDLKRFFKLGGGQGRELGAPRTSRPTRVLYLGRRHPLKGVGFLRRAVEELNGEAESFPLQEEDPSLLRSGKDSASPLVQLRIVSDHFGEELERDWEWCDVLCLPTLSENFGLVVAEALERGKRVIVTDGAPAWGEGEMFECSECSNARMGYGGRLIYLKGYRNGTDAMRVKLLKEALTSLIEGQASSAGLNLV